MTEEDKRIAEEALTFAEEQSEDVPREWEETEGHWENRQKRIREGLVVLKGLLT